MKKILFQGDSITDCSRNREKDRSMGEGWANMVAGKLGSEHPGEYMFLNRGIGGNRSIDVCARIEKDILNLAPDYMSILMGVNDVWHGYDGNQAGISAKRFERNYRMLLDDVMETLPNIKIMILGAYVTDGRVLEQYGQEFKQEVDLRIEATKRIAKDYGLPFVDLQSVFNEACAKAPACYWTVEGVHPTPAGHALIAKQWLKTFETMRIGG